MCTVLKARDVSARLGVSLPVAYELMARSDFPSFRPSERTVRTTDEALDSWVKRQMYSGIGEQA